MKAKDTAPIPLQAFALFDVQGLWGGRALWAAVDRVATIQIVQPGLWEKRYQVILTDSQWAEVERLVACHHFFTLTVAERPGVPDEAHPVILAFAESGQAVRVGKWASDRHQDFDPIYDYLCGLCHVEGKTFHEGRYAWDWQPEGFARLR